MHASFVKRALPSATVASLRSGGVPRLTTAFRSSLESAKRGEKVLIYSTTATGRCRRDGPARAASAFQACPSTPTEINPHLSEDGSEAWNAGGNWLARNCEVSAAETPRRPLSHLPARRGK